jgi:hypothetical protein
MPRRTGLFCLAVVAVLAFASCGSNKTATGTSTVVVTGNSSSPPREIKYAPVRSAAYTANLSGTNGASPGLYRNPPGAPNGSGQVAITINAPKRTLCWKFSQLKNVPAPTVARVYYRAAGRFSFLFGFRLGRTYKASGCIRTPEGTKSIEYGPQEWWVSIHSAKFPRGAVRGPL